MCLHNQTRVTLIPLQCLWSNFFVQLHWIAFHFTHDFLLFYLLLFLSISFQFLGFAQVLVQKLKTISSMETSRFTYEYFKCSFIFDKVSPFVLAVGDATALSRGLSVGVKYSVFERSQTNAVAVRLYRNPEKWRRLGSSEITLGQSRLIMN